MPFRHLRPGSVVDDVERALEGFRGTFNQLPPPYSAKKIDGVRAYKLARKRMPVQPTAARVTVHHLAIENYNDGLVERPRLASAGFYVRSLAHDLGQKLGCGAHLETLRRVRAGSFVEHDSVVLSTLEREGVEGARRSSLSNGCSPTSRLSFSRIAIVNGRHTVRRFRRASGKAEGATLPVDGCSTAPDN